METNYNAILTRRLYVNDSASLSVVLTDVHRTVFSIQLYDSFKFNTTGQVLSKVTFASDASEYTKESARALLGSNLNSFETIFAGSGSYEFQVVDGARAMRFERSNTVTLNDSQEIVTPVGGQLIVDNGETMIVDAANSPLVPHVKIAQKLYYLDVVNMGPIGAGSFDVTPDKEQFQSGEVAQISFDAKDGYVIDVVRRDGVEIDTSRNLEQYTVNEIMTEHVTFDVKFKLAPVKYSITINCGDNGTCSKNPDQSSYIAGNEVTIGAVADPGYVIDTFSLNPAAADRAYYYMAVDMTNDWTLDVSFKPTPAEHTVVFSTCDSTQGTCIIDPEATTYTHGSKIDVEVEPKPGLEIDTVTINGEAQTITDRTLWTKSAIFVTGDLDFVATFRPETFVIALAVSSPPAKVHYTEGNQLDLFGLGVFIKRSDNTTEQVTYGDFVAYGITPSPDQGTVLNPAHKNIIITHTASSRTAKQAITVVKKEDPVTPPIPIPTSTVYRFWSDKLQAHFYTISQAEKEYIEKTYPTVWKFEGLAYHAYAKQAPGTSPVYRFWSDKLQAHFYTISQEEKAYIEKTYAAVWTFEGIAWYANPSNVAGTSPLYRFWSNDKQVHFYTVSQAEKEEIQRKYPAHVWNYEGIAYYAQK